MGNEQAPGGLEQEQPGERAAPRATQKYGAGGMARSRGRQIENRARELKRQRERRGRGESARNSLKAAASKGSTPCAFGPCLGKGANRLQHSVRVHCRPRRPPIPNIPSRPPTRPVTVRSRSWNRSFNRVVPGDGSGSRRIVHRGTQMCTASTCSKGQTNAAAE